ncbi:hypothetical protein C8R46DRAFT_672731 [Mycena filopes]|nr:hypothetical protein C8R46DRAFT_672731 [Mycena filopes]
MLPLERDVASAPPPQLVVMLPRRSRGCLKRIHDGPADECVVHSRAHSASFAPPRRHEARHPRALVPMRILLFQRPHPHPALLSSSLTKRRATHSRVPARVRLTPRHRSWLPLPPLLTPLQPIWTTPNALLSLLAVPPPAPRDIYQPLLCAMLLIWWKTQRQWIPGLARIAHRAARPGWKRGGYALSRGEDEADANTDAQARADCGSPLPAVSRWSRRAGKEACGVGPRARDAYIVPVCRAIARLEWSTTLDCDWDCLRRCGWASSG